MHQVARVGRAGHDAAFCEFGLFDGRHGRGDVGGHRCHSCHDGGEVGGERNAHCLGRALCDGDTRSHQRLADGHGLLYLGLFLLVVGERLGQFAERVVEASQHVGGGCHLGGDGLGAFLGGLLLKLGHLVVLLLLQCDDLVVELLALFDCQVLGGVEEVLQGEDAVLVVHLRPVYLAKFCLLLLGHGFGHGLVDDALALGEILLFLGLHELVEFLAALLGEGGFVLVLLLKFLKFFLVVEHQVRQAARALVLDEAVGVLGQLVLDRRLVLGGTFDSGGCLLGALGLFVVGLLGLVGGFLVLPRLLGSEVRQRAVEAAHAVVVRLVGLYHLDARLRQAVLHLVRGVGVLILLLKQEVVAVGGEFLLLRQRVALGLDGLLHELDALLDGVLVALRGLGLELGHLGLVLCHGFAVLALLVLHGVGGGHDILRGLDLVGELGQQVGDFVGHPADGVGHLLEAFVQHLEDGVERSPQAGQCGRGVVVLGDGLADLVEDGHQGGESRGYPSDWSRQDGLAEGDERLARSRHGGLERAEASARQSLKAGAELAEDALHLAERAAHELGIVADVSLVVAQLCVEVLQALLRFNKLLFEFLSRGALALCGAHGLVLLLQLSAVGVKLDERVAEALVGRGLVLYLPGQGLGLCLEQFQGFVVLGHQLAVAPELVITRGDFLFQLALQAVERSDGRVEVGQLLAGRCGVDVDDD